MKKPSWKLWLVGVTLWAAFWLVTRIILEGSFHREMVGGAAVSALVGGTLMWFYGFRKWKKQSQ